MVKISKDEDNFPDDTLKEIYSFLPLEDQVSCCYTNKDFRRVLQEYWKGNKLDLTAENLNPRQKSAALVLHPISLSLHAKEIEIKLEQMEVFSRFFAKFGSYVENQELRIRVPIIDEANISNIRLDDSSWEIVRNERFNKVTVYSPTLTRTLFERIENPMKFSISNNIALRNVLQSNVFQRASLYLLSVFPSNPWLCQLYESSMNRMAISAINVPNDLSNKVVIEQNTVYLSLYKFTDAQAVQNDVNKWNKCNTLIIDCIFLSDRGEFFNQGLMAHILGKEVDKIVFHMIGNNNASLLDEIRDNVHLFRGKEVQFSFLMGDAVNKLPAIINNLSDKVKAITFSGMLTENAQIVSIIQSIKNKKEINHISFVNESSLELEKVKTVLNNIENPSSPLTIDFLLTKDCSPEDSKNNYLFQYIVDKLKKHDPLASKIKFNFLQEKERTQPLFEKRKIINFFTDNRKFIFEAIVGLLGCLVAININALGVLLIFGLLEIDAIAHIGRSIKEFFTGINNDQKLICDKMPLVEKFYPEEVNKICVDKTNQVELLKSQISYSQTLDWRARYFLQRAQREGNNLKNFLS